MNQIDDRLYLFATIRSKPEFFEHTLNALNNLVPTTLEEPGCHSFTAFISRDEVNTLHLFECFEDEIALQQHYDQPYTKTVFEHYKDWLAAPVEVSKLRAAAFMP